MLDNVVVVPVEMSNDDFSIIIEVSKRTNTPRNEVIRTLIRLGLEKVFELGDIDNVAKKGKRGGKK